MATSPTQTEAQDLGKIEKQPSTPPENGRQTESSSGDVDLDKAPDGGLEAWLVAAGGASIFFSCLGFANSFGVFQEYYMTHQLKGWSPDDVAWIGSLAAFIQFAAGAIGGPLFDRLGAWVSLPSLEFRGCLVNSVTGCTTSCNCLHLCHHDDQPLP